MEVNTKHIHFCEVLKTVEEYTNNFNNKQTIYMYIPHHPNGRVLTYYSCFQQLLLFIQAYLAGTPLLLISLVFRHFNLFDLDSNSVRLKTFESVLCLSGPVGALSQADVDVLKTAVAKLMVKPSITGKFRV